MAEVAELRLAEALDCAELRCAELAPQATAAQLAKTVSGYRTAAGQRLKQERERRFTWTERESGRLCQFHHPEALRIQPGWRGERHDRHEAVQALFRMPIRDRVPASEAA